LTGEKVSVHGGLVILADDGPKRTVRVQLAQQGHLVVQIRTGRPGGTFADEPHPDLGATWTYPVRKWLSTEPAWKVRRRAPLVGEDSARVWTDLAGARPRPPFDDAMLATLTARAPHQKPMPLDGVRVLDFTWFLAGGTRFLSAYRRRVVRDPGRARHPRHGLRRHDPRAEH
jgi:hypothetical protein